MERLQRFIEAQEHVYEKVLRELNRGKKTSHWMWYIFPQLRRLGMSETAHTYSIVSIHEAKAYLQHPVLGARLIECCEVLLTHKDKSAAAILGDTDAAKLRSSMTLFELVSDTNPIFHTVLHCFFDGKKDPGTLVRIHRKHHFKEHGMVVLDGVLVGCYGVVGDITLPDTVTAIDTMAFYGCRELTGVTIPDGVTSIGDEAFLWCENLENVTFPRTAHVGHNAFMNCDKLSLVQLSCPQCKA